MQSPSRVALSLLATLTASCLTSSESGLRGSGPTVVERRLPTRAWLVEAGGRVEGSLVLYEARLGGEALWVVQNLWGQDEGYIDAKGRAWRFLPHVEGAQALGTAALGEGVARVLALRHSPILLQISPAELLQNPVDAPPNLGN